MNEQRAKLIEEREHAVRRAVFDCRGVEIEIGASVVVAGTDGRLHERKVTGIRQMGSFTSIHFDRGSHTSSNRVAVVAD